MQKYATHAEVVFLICPEKAIKEITYRVGTVEIGSNGSLHYAGGSLDLGVATIPPIIRYEYICLSCNHQFELKQSISEPPLNKCF